MILLIVLQITALPSLPPYVQAAITGDDGLFAIRVDREVPMKTIISVVVIVVLSALAGVAAPAGAFDAMTSYDQQTRQTH